MPPTAPTLAPDPQGAIHRQFARYIVSGVLSSGLDWGLFWLLYALLHLPWVYANTSAMFITLWFNFLINRLWSFASAQPIGNQILRYVLLVAVNMILSNAIIYLAADILLLDRMLAKGVAIAFIVSWNFVIYRHVVYR